MSEVLITGAGGFLGGHLTQVFLEAGHTVRAADLPSVDLTSLEALGASAIPCDVTSDTSVEAALKGIQVVVHAAGIFDLTADPDLLEAVNAQGARRMIEHAAKEGIDHFVLVSSTSVYGRGADQTAEADPKRPKHPYATSKWAGELAVTQAAHRLGVPLSVLRPSLIYGEGSRYGLAPWVAIFALRLRRGLKPLPIAQGGPLGHVVHAKDVARAALHVTQGPHLGAFNVADDAPMRAGETVRVIAGAVGAEVGDSPLPWGMLNVFRLGKPLLAKACAKQNPRLDRAWQRLVEEDDLLASLSPRLDVDWIDFLSANHVYDNSALRETGFELEFPDARIGLPSTVDWYRSQRWIPAS